MSGTVRPNVVEADQAEKAPGVPLLDGNRRRCRGGAAGQGEHSGRGHARERGEDRAAADP
jgi:hypothetical protein